MSVTRVEDSTPARCCCWVDRPDETASPTCTLCLGTGFPIDLVDRPSVFLANLKYFFGKTDGTYEYPKGAVGDLLKQAKREIEAHVAKAGSK
jgi:hypothetical protein